MLARLYALLCLTVQKEITVGDEVVTGRGRKGWTTDYCSGEFKVVFSDGSGFDYIDAQFLTRTGKR